MSRRKEKKEKKGKKREKDTPTVGLEPTTTRLRALRSTDWARRASYQFIIQNISKICLIFFFTHITFPHTTHTTTLHYYARHILLWDTHPSYPFVISPPSPTEPTKSKLYIQSTHTLYCDDVIHTTTLLTLSLSLSLYLSIYLSLSLLSFHCYTLFYCKLCPFSTHTHTWLTPNQYVW